MTGVNGDGEAVDYHRRHPSRPVPRGPLSRVQVAGYQKTIAQGLKAVEGLSNAQIGQIFGVCKLTIHRRGVEMPRPSRVSGPG